MYCRRGSSAADGPDAAKAVAGVRAEREAAAVMPAVIRGAIRPLRMVMLVLLGRSTGQDTILASGSWARIAERRDIVLPRSGEDPR
ncbi:hypothetical protein GCM10010507_01230 [Streptomyces cinnamoneus]|uniref:Uncharacterized protein n=1 Tax=Streptomyces cinnamoneus TaxID=53446 RepID=A0A918T8P4_STRCJ|nr:hypothetical protein GCM10010507_01230 [Streptomyces cinnamoneus]